MYRSTPFFFVCFCFWLAAAIDWIHHNLINWSPFDEVLGFPPVVSPWRCGRRGFPTRGKFSVNLKRLKTGWDVGNETVYSLGSASSRWHQLLSLSLFSTPPCTWFPGSHLPSSLCLTTLPTPNSGCLALSPPHTFAHYGTGRKSVGSPDDWWSPDQLCTSNGVQERIGASAPPLPWISNPWTGQQLCCQ